MKHTYRWQCIYLLICTVAIGYMFMLASEPVPELPTQNLLESRLLEGSHES